MLGFFEILISGSIQGEVVISSDYDFVFVGQETEKLSESGELSHSGKFCEVARVDEDVSWGEAFDIDSEVHIVRIGHSHYSHQSLLRLHIQVSITNYFFD